MFHTDNGRVVAAYLLLASVALALVVAFLVLL